MADGPRKSLPEILDELHSALAASPELSSDVRAELETTAEEIQTALGDSGESDLFESLRGRLNEALERFEGEHPRLTEAVGRIADALADLGI